MSTGLAGFKDLLREFRGLSAWAVGAGVAVPFAAALADFAPPWPKGVVFSTAICELVALVLVYQFLRASPKKIINRTLAISATLLAIAGLAYLALSSLYVFEIPTTHERWVKGFECTQAAQTVFKTQCPDLGMDALRTAEYEAERLWTAQSVTLVRMALVALWSLAFTVLSTLLGAFIVYQSKVRPRAR